MTAGNEYAASEMRYWCRTGDYGGVGYSQPNRWSAYDHSSWAGWLTGPGEMDCSAGVAGAYNIAFHECGASHPLFPRSTWTGSLPGEAAQHGFTDIGDTWTGSAPDGGFRAGDLLMADGHVAMAVRNLDDSFTPDDPLLAEAWIDAAGDILGSDGADGSTGDDTGGETRVIRYSDHPHTQRATWTTCLRYVGSAPAPAPRTSTPSADNATRMSGIDISMHQDGIDIPATGAQFVIAKATEGSGYTDPCFHKFAQATLDAGKLLGAYHFAWNSANSVEEEATTFLDTVRPYLGRALLVLDWEDPDGTADVAWAKAWLDQVTARTGIRPVIYMSASVAQAHAWEAVAKDYWLWVAGYPGGAPDHLATPDCPYAPLPHGWWTLMWQYTSEGRVPGYGGDIDLNACYRSSTKWEALADPSHSSGTNYEKDDLDMSENTDLLREIRDLFRSGKEGSHFAGDMNWYARATWQETKAIREAQAKLDARLAAIEKNTATAGK